MDKTIRFKLNGKEVRVESPPERMLLWVLRTDLGYTGTKYGCGEGFCGACTVLVDGKPTLSCQFPLAKAEGKSVLTIESLARGGRLHPLQQAFVDHGALQCGYCTPGMIMAAVTLLQDNPTPSEQEIREGISGNFCRCTGYQHIVNAIQRAANDKR